MAYNVRRGGKLTFADFREVRRRVTAILQDDTNNPVTTGYGHSPSAFPVVRGDTIRASDWGGIFSDLNKLYQHQYGRVMTDAEYKIQQGATFVTPQRGQVFAKSYLDRINTTIAAVESNPLRAHNSSLSLVSLGSSTRATPWGRSIGSIRSVDTFTFASTDAARYFFNSGGQIRLSLSHPNIRGNVADNDWYEITRRIGQISIGATSITQTGNTGMAINSGLGGWYSLSTNETVILSAVNSGGVYNHTWFTRYNSIKNLFRANDVYISIYKSTPATPNGPISLNIAVMLNDEVRTITGINFVPNANNSSGTKVTYTATKASTPLNNIATPTFATSNFTSTPMIPAQPATFTMMRTFSVMGVTSLDNPTKSDVNVEIDVKESFRSQFSVNSVTYLGSSMVNIRVPQETIEYCEVLPAIGESVTPDVVGRTREVDGMTLELASRETVGGSTKAKIRIKTFERENWIVVEEVNVGLVGSVTKLAYVADETISTTAGYPVNLSVNANQLRIEPKDNAKVGMVSVWEEKGSKLTPPQITASEVVDGSRVIDFTITNSAVGELEYSTRKKMLVVPSVLFSREGTELYFAKEAKRSELKVTVHNTTINGTIVGKAYFSSEEKITSIAFTNASEARAADESVQVTAVSYDSVVESWVAHYTIPETSFSGFATAVVNFGGAERTFRDISLRNFANQEITSDIYRESNKHSINSTEESPVFNIVSTYTASTGNGQLHICEEGKSFAIDSVELIPSAIGTPVSKVEWLSEGEKGGKYSLKFNSKTGTHSTLRIVSGARVYYVQDVRTNRSATCAYIGRMDPNPNQVEIRHTSIVSVFPSRVMVVLTIGATGKEVTNFFRSNTWSSGWEPAEPPKFDAIGTTTSKGEIIKEVEIPISHWTESKVKDVSLMIKFSDRLYCRAEINLLDSSKSVFVDVLENTSED